MIYSRRALHTVFAGLFVTASLGPGVSAERKTVFLDQNSGRMTAPTPAPLNSKDSLSGYDIAAGEDFLVSATPGHFAEVQTVTGGDRGSTGVARDADRNVTIYHSRAAARHLAVGIFSDSLTPAQVSVDDAASVTEEQSLVTLPVDLTLVPGTDGLAAVPDRSFMDGSQPAFFNAAGPDKGPGFGAAPRRPSPTDLACLLYTPFTGPEPSSYALLGLERAGWTLPAPSSGH